MLDAVLFDKLDKLKLMGEAEISFYKLGVNSKKKSKVGQLRIAQFSFSRESSQLSTTEYDSQEVNIIAGDSRSTL